MCDLIRHMEETIEALRKQMHRVAIDQGGFSGNVLFLSQELDKLLNIYERLKVRAGRI